MDAGDQNETLDESDISSISGPLALSESSYAQTLDAKLEELDDIEYEIPTIETPPTLESILYDSDDASLSDEEAAVQIGLFHEIGDSASVASAGSLDSKGQRPDRSRQRKSLPQKMHGSILRHVTLRGISSQLISAADRVLAGMPTAMAVSSLIAIGTSHGIVLVFDVKQALKWCLGGTATGDQYGSVSCLGFNHNCTRLLCGFAKGQITMWDAVNGKLLRTIMGSHPLGTAVLHVQFTDDPTLAVCSDSGGSVFELTFKRVMGVRGCDSRCIFSGSRGEVCAIQVLNMIHLKEHPLQDVCIIAMATLSKVIVVSIRPYLKVLFTHSLKANPTTLPILSWQFAVIQVTASERVIDPVLSFGRESTTYFFQVAATSKDRIQFVPLQKMNLHCLCLNFLWLNSRTMVILDVTEHLHVIDVRTQEELEILDLADVQLVYGSSYFKGLATGGNVSKAMALAGEHSCFQSMAVYKGQLLLLGTKSVHVLTLRTWNERIDQLVKQARFSEALMLALSFYEDKAKAVVGLVNKKEKKKAILADKMLDLILMFVDHAVNTVPETGSYPDVIEEHFMDVIPICIEYCIILDKKYLIFEKFYETFSTYEISRGIFLESLEPHILNDSLKYITPVILKDFVEHYEARGQFDVLESCIIHLDVANLDLHHVVTLCRNHGLYDAIIYIFTRGMGDYNTPFQELMAILQKEIQSGKALSSEVINIGNKLLVYTSCCLAGRAYPLGSIPEGEKVMVKTEIFRCLTMLHTRNAPDDEPPYPYLRTFLHFDTRELLNVMALAFEEPEFNKDAGVLQQQRLVDILLQIMVDGEGFSPSQVGALFTFLARQMAKPNNVIVVNRALFEQVLEYLTNPGDETRHAERQQALLELLYAGGLQHYDELQLLELANAAAFYQVCELFYEKRREYFKIISCYLKDLSRKVDVFDFIKQNLDSNKLSDAEKNAIETEVVLKIEELVAVNSSKTSEMLITCFPTKIPSIIENLESNPEMLFRFLGGLLDLSSHKMGAMELLLHNSSLREKYIRLLCEFEPHNVVQFVKSTDDLKMEATLEIVREFDIRDAVAYLLEKMGDVQGAFAIVLENFRESLMQFSNQLIGLTSTINNADMFIHVSSIKYDLNNAVEFCQRNSSKVDEPEREEIWFPLLESVLMQHKSYGDKLIEQVHLAFKELTDHLLNSMMGYIKMPSILQKIIQDPAYKSSQFGEMKELLLGMLDTYNYEMTLLKATKSLVNGDLHDQLVHLQKIANQGYASHNNICSGCNRKLNHIVENDSIVLFRCGHAYHENCLSAEVPSEKQTSQKHASCILCRENRHEPIVAHKRCVSDKSQVGMTLSRNTSHPWSLDHNKLKIHLEPEQLRALEVLNHTFDSPSLNVSAVGGRRTKSDYRSQDVMSSFHRECLALHLSPPRNKPIPDDF